MTPNKDIKEIIDKLPEKPGVYQYYNSMDELIYVGKAKNLKKRVCQYFYRNHESPKTTVLVQKIHNIKYIMVDSEEEALLLENSLIKQYLPRYNLSLKDDKTYPSICIKNEPFPRVFKTRHLVKDGSEYFGPYASVYMITILLELAHELFPIRSCKLPLTEEKIQNKKFNVCLQYHLKKCKAPCIGLQSKKEYMQNICKIRKILEGGIHTINEYLLKEMLALAEECRFEEAQAVKKKYQIIERYKAKSIVVNTKLDKIDVFGYDEDEQSAYINILRIIKGSIIQGFTIEYRKRFDKKKEDLLATAIIELRNTLKSDSAEIIVPFLPEIQFADIVITVPAEGDKQKLLYLSQQNVRQFKLEKLKQQEKFNSSQRDLRILSNLQHVLRLTRPPMRIECFDNSNMQGSNAVAACVVFRKAKPSKGDYRKYTIKTVAGPDDYASMKEVVRRRYERAIKDAIPLPDLVIADGGVGQMEAIRQVVENELGLNIPIAGLTKNQQHRTRELLFGFPPKVIGIRPTGELFKFLATIQEEVHRFAISFHRKKRSKAQVTSELDNIKGIGEKTKKELLSHFKSIKRLKSAKFEDIKNVIGKQRTSITYKHFHPKSKL